MCGWGLLAALYLLFLICSGGVAHAYLTGHIVSTVQLLPTPKLYRGEVELSVTFAGWTLTTESRFYASGLRYQTFSFSADLATMDLGGRFYFHVQEARYRKAVFDLEIPFAERTLDLELRHWSSKDEYSDSDENRFGPWPCKYAVSWDKAWLHIGQEVWVEGPVVGFSHSGYLKLYLGHDYPNPYRFEIYVPSTYLDDLEAAFGPEFWTAWADSRLIIRVSGLVRGYRRTYGGPRDGGYSVAQIKVTSPTSIDPEPAGRCVSGIAMTCGSDIIRWFEVHMHGGESIWIQGPVASVTGPGTYYGYANAYRVRIGGGGSVDNRVEVIMTDHPGWPTEGVSFDTVVCVYGRITMHGDIAVIEPPDLIDAREGPCCGAPLVSGPLTNLRIKLAWDPLTLTLDIGDCCTGFSFRRAELTLSDLSLCCGLMYNTSLVFSKCHGFEKLTFNLDDVRFPCCDISFEAEVAFAPDGKSVSIKPVWEGLVAACLEVYGDVQRSKGVLGGFALYGFSIECYFDSVSIRSVTAFDPDQVEAMTEVSFRSGEFEYLRLEYAGSGCCSGNLTFTSQFWFGSEGVLFDLQRARFDLEFPLYQGFTVIVKGQWDFSDTLEWFDIGWKIEF